MKTKIELGSRVQINVGSKFARGIVKSVADYSIGDIQNLYIEMTDEDTGEYHYWKQDQDGGSIELLKPVIKSGAKSVQIRKLDYTSSKQAEIEALEKMVEAAGSQTLLAQLFTKDAIEWIKDQIKADRSPDLFTNYSYYMSAANSLINQKDQLEVQIEFNKTIHEDDLKTLGKQVQEANEKAAKRWEEVQELRDIISQDSQKIQELNSQVIDRDIQIRTLKAMIFDLEHPEGK